MPNDTRSVTKARGWRKDAAAGRWSAIDWLRLRRRKDRLELLEMLQAVVPKLEVRNGVEAMPRFARPQEVEDSELRAAALILALGELEASVEGMPIASKRWANLRAEVEAVLQTASKAPEMTTGDPELSMRAHCEEAFAILRELDFVTSAMKLEMKSDRDRKWLEETISEIAILALTAGTHIHAVQLKPFEAIAVRKTNDVARNQDNAPKGGEVRKARAARERALLKNLALSEAEYPQWIIKDDKGQVRQLRMLGIRLATEHAAEGLFLSRGKPYEPTWFRGFLSDLRASGEINKISNNKKLKPGRPVASLQKPR